MVLDTPFALVLAGGGARGAYEAGVLRFILGELPKRIGHPIRAELICGSSVGGLNGAAIGAWNGDPQGPMELSDFWSNLKVADIYRFEALDLLRSPMRLLRGPADNELAWVDARPLHSVMRDFFPWQQLWNCIDDGRLRALVTTATDVHSGQIVQFVDGSLKGESTTGNRGVRTEYTRIKPEHVLASCAIPFLFPPINIDGRAMVDGSLRQNTPISPALRLGAQHVLVVGTRFPRPATSPAEDAPLPSTPALLGKALNSLLLDPLHQDMAQIEFINSILDAGQSQYGPDFVDRINRTIEASTGRTLRTVDTLSILPTEDLGRVAKANWDPQSVKTTKGTRFMLSQIAGSGEESDLLSYLLFDGSYTRVIEDLGYADAERRETEIIRFFEGVVAR
ncbi:MAG: patatin-like phospholipase family protein [Myxococcota bacterium]|nr:patatin-like phospholipase family protein [Myxococcota bacterium]